MGRAGIELACVLILLGLARTVLGSGGITPEQIYQATVDWKSLIATWEALPDDSPLAEKNSDNAKSQHRTLIALRKDGTCRVFNPDFPMGADCLWTFEDHRLFITFPGGLKVDYYVYGIKGDFMITRSPIKDGKDQLWARVK